MKKKTSLAKQLKELTDKGLQIRFTWDGGNDSGCYDLEIRGAGTKKFTSIKHDDSAPWYDDLEDIISEVLGYDGFAGDYSATGELLYNPKTQRFEGCGYDSTDESDSIGGINLKVLVPEYLPFDTIDISTEGYLNDLDDFQVRVDLLIQNGPVFQEHIDLEKKISKDIENNIRSILSVDKHVDRVSSCYNDWQFTREDMVKDGKGNLIALIESIDFSFTDTQEKYFEIKI